MAADAGEQVVRAQHHHDRVPADDAANAQLHRLVAGEGRLLLGRDRVDVARLDESRQAELQHARALQHLEQQEVGALAAAVAHHVVQGFDPFARLGRIGVGKLALERAEQAPDLDPLAVASIRDQLFDIGHGSSPIEGSAAVRRSASIGA
jgi:hypothetical protein